jgi:oxygen-independent coproporphyrinogen III oxidase
MKTTFPAVTEELLARLDVQGPRYTSYPTVADWMPDFDEHAHRRHLQAARAAGKDEPLSLYVHIPFCRQRCTFCGCNVVVAQDRSRADEYIDYLARELDLVADLLGDRRKLSQIHWGGGTPTFLSEAQIERLYREITARFQPLPDAETAIEIDPVETTPSQVSLLRSLGFNRMSIGIQDFDPTVQNAIARVQSIAETKAIIDEARRVGFGSVSFDLIYGLPHQTQESWRRSLGEVLRLRPDRVALYSFAFIPEVRPHQRRLPIADLPLGINKLALFGMAFDAFMDAGYVQIGMDHFALPEDELARARSERRLNRNFQGYTVSSAEDVVAFGVSAISDVQGAYAQNVQALRQYYARIDEGRLPTDRGIALDDDDRRRRDLIRELMCNFSADLGADGTTYFARELDVLRAKENEGLFVKCGRRLELTELGRIFVRNVAMIFDARLAAYAGKTRFSRTV